MTKRYTKKDPHATREAEKYARPIPSREYILEYMEKLGRPVKMIAIAEHFDLIEDEELMIALNRRLGAMSREGQLLRNRRNLYAISDKLELIRGRVIGKKDGYGFVAPDDGCDDIFLSPFEMQAVFPDDEVLIRVTGFDRRGRHEGTIVEILERKTQSVVGILREEEGVYFLVPDNKNMTHDIIINKENLAGAKVGQYIMAEILAQPSKRRSPTGKVIEIVGDHLAPGMEIEVAVRAHGLRHAWPKQVLKELQDIPGEVVESDLKGRKDLRDLAFVTIDGKDAQDFDDAVYCEPLPSGGWRLHVAIADVSHYVKTGTALDKEAYLRGNSVYFPGRVLPMLPEALSNGLCSLRPKVDRLCMVCEIQFDADGQMVHHDFYPGVIFSHARLTYSGVAEMIKEGLNDKDKITLNIRSLNSLYKVLHKRRSLRGALDFVTTETRIIFGEGNKIKKIVPVERNDAHKIIEECMLRANVATALFLIKHKMPVLFRVHEGPSNERLEKLRDFLKGVGLRLPGGDSPTSKDYSQLLDRIEKRADAQLIQLVILRSLSQAIYTPRNEGHFGLAYDAYCHYTSPIRRYPDLNVHRAIRYVLEKKAIEKYTISEYEMAELGRHCSKTERNADLASRDVEDWLKCHFMLDRVGEEFSGIISDIKSFGIFVKLQDVYVEGLIHITALENDYFQYDAQNHKLVGKRSGMVYRLGDTIKIRVARVDLDERQMDFALPGEPKKKKKKKPKRK